ncbi:PD-(D/E)XK nuclease family protein [Campylobacter majalis]|uniref:PD-(D/E)XK nuclease family protein n=1 Tax=Campylobacter majalis TaxID=2790656 RepID=UPI003D6961A3
MKTQQDIIGLNYSQTNRLYVFSSTRAIREFAKSHQNSLLPKLISIGDFFDKCIYVKDYIKPSQAELMLCMQEACLKTQKLSSELKIPTDFFSFLKNKEYIFSFFKEISHQLKNVDDLKFADIYDSYEEHIEILSNLFKNYQEILSLKGYYDDITLPKNYYLNHGFIKAFDEILIQIDGVLSEFEWGILLEISKLTTLKISFITSVLNKKLTDKIVKISNAKIENYYKYELNLSTNELTKNEALPRNKNILTREFSMRSLQAAYVFEKISTFVLEGIDPSEIAVILPDESFSEILRLHDTHNFLSYAMGRSVSNTKLFIALTRVIELFDSNTDVNFDIDIKSRTKLNQHDAYFILNKISKQDYELLSANFSKVLSYEKTIEILTQFAICMNASKQLLNILSTEIFALKPLMNRLKFHEILRLLLLELKTKTLDDVGGGAVRVMGLLESRGLEYKGVIIVDFNDDLVPKRSTNELFLSSVVRKKAGLISYTERENLQRSYYERLINNAKKVAISYVKNDEQIGSRFLKEFKCFNDESYSDDEYIKIFKSGKVAKFHEIYEGVNHDIFSERFSFSRLSTILACQRKYYYKYVLKIPEQKCLDDVPASEYGVIIHQALRDYYSSNDKFDSEKFCEILKPKLNPLDYEIARIKFKKFQENENMRFNEGWSIKEMECEKEVVLNGIKLYGVIDRIDINGENISVIDYKTGSSADVLQLEFYKILIQNDQASSYFYDLKEKMSLISPNKSKNMPDIYEKLYELKNTPLDYEPNVTSKNCNYCQYKALCRGEV